MKWVQNVATGEYFWGWSFGDMVFTALQQANPIEHPMTPEDVLREMAKRGYQGVVINEQGRMDLL